MNRFIEKISSQQQQLVAPFCSNLAMQLQRGNYAKALQNPQFHYQLLQTLQRKFQPQFIFPLMNISCQAIALGKSAQYFVDAAPRVNSESEEATAIFSDQTKFWQNQDLVNYLKTLELMAQNLPPSTIKCAYLTGPFTLTCLLNGFAQTKADLSKNPPKIKNLVTACRELNTELAQKISELGIEAIVLLEPAASLLTAEDFRKFLQQPLASLAAEYARLQLGSILHICGNTTPLFPSLASTNFQALSLDSAAAGVNLAEAASQLDSEQYIWGNLDPQGIIYQGSSDQVRHEILKLLKQMQAYPKFILGSGCDLKQNTPAANIRVLLDFGR